MQWASNQLWPQAKAQIELNHTIPNRTKIEPRMFQTKKKLNVHRSLALLKYNFEKKLHIMLDYINDNCFICAFLSFWNCTSRTSPLHHNRVRCHVCHCDTFSLRFYHTKTKKQPSNGFFKINMHFNFYKWNETTTKSARNIPIHQQSYSVSHSICVCICFFFFKFLHFAA